MWYLDRGAGGMLWWAGEIVVPEDLKHVGVGRHIIVLFIAEGKHMVKSTTQNTKQSMY